MNKKKNIKKPIDNSKKNKNSQGMAQKPSVEKVKAENISKKNNRDDEPSWYHYLFVLVIFAAVIGIVWAGYYFFEPEDPTSTAPVLYKYVYKVGNVTYNLYFESKTSEIREMPYEVQLDKYDVLNTIRFRMSFDDYNGTDNGQIAKASTKLTSFLKFVYQFRFTNTSFVKTDVITCANSTTREKVITFDPYSDVTGVFYDELTGCIEFKSDDPTKMIDLADKFIYEMVDLENED